VAGRFGDRGLKVYREVRIGKSIIGKNRCIDVFCVAERDNKAFAIECKFQESVGTVDEKIPYAIDDLRALPMAGCIAYAGRGFSEGVLHMLRASPHAAYCLPASAQTQSTADTRELDHLLAMHFGWWDVLVAGRRPVSVLDTAPDPRAQRDQKPEADSDAASLVGFTFQDARED
jgi:hypothetical protein